jgi:short-subunit dehydrogenase
MIDLNVKTLCLLSLLFVKNNKDKDAQLINVSSGLGYFTYGLAVTCSATKYFVSAFTEGIAQNLKSE